MNKDKLFLIFKTLLSIALLFILILIMRAKINEILAIIKSTNILLFLAAFLIYAAGTIVLCAVRLKKIFLAHNINIPLWHVINMVYIGQFFNNFMPSTIGGDIYKIYQASRHAPRPMNAVISVGMDRFIGFFATVIIAIFALIFGYQFIHNKAVIYVFSVLLIASFIFILFLSNKNLAKKLSFILKLFKPVKLDQKLKDFYCMAYEFKSNKKLIAVTIFLSLVLQVLSILMVYMLALSINVKISFMIFLLLMPVITVISQMPSLNGLGIREGAFVYFFKEFMPAESALALSLLFLGVMIMSSIVGGVFYMLKRPVKKEESA